jgi:signal transduction histidine kinase
MSEPVWYRSLYWRIAFGFVAMLAALLLAQGVVLLWLTDRIVGGSSRSPAQLAAVVAADLSNALSEQPTLALEDRVRSRFGHIYQPFVVAMHDGRTTTNRPGPLPPGFMRTVRQHLRNEQQEPPSDIPANGSRPPPPRAETAPIMVGGSEVGIVAVPSNPLPVFAAIRELGPTLTWVGVGLLGIGSAVAALLIFRPAHRRLRSLEQATRALGEGRTDVRAVVGGGDEVSSLAHVFNRMADDLSARATALATSDRARRQLLADVSHELMTPLAAIRGYTETLAMPELDLNLDTRQRYLGIVGEETQKLESLIGDLLDLARLEGGGGALNIVDVPVKDLFERVADRHGPALRDRRITLDLAVEPDTLTVLADAHRLEQALQNLAANALRHTPAGGRITLEAQGSGLGTTLSSSRGRGSPSNDVRIVVRNTGPGISPEHLPHIFERFYKGDASRSSSDHLSGSGLGLSIVQAIVERHGGSISASNGVDGGAVFELTLPANSRPS